MEATEVDPEVLREAGLVHKRGLVKVLGDGELTRRVNVSAHAFSASAAAAIQAAGGSINVLPPPFGHGRPPAKGNALYQSVAGAARTGKTTWTTADRDTRTRRSKGRRYANTHQPPEPKSRVPHRGPAQQDPVHPVHHRGVPSGRQHHLLPAWTSTPSSRWPRPRNKGGVIAYLNLFSGGALTKMAVFGLGIMPYITSSIIIQLLMVVIPKFEQWREEGPSGQRKLTQVTRYMTIALAIMQSTGSGLRLPQRRRRLARHLGAAQRGPHPRLHRAPCAADRDHHDGRHGRGHVAGRADHPAGRRPGHVGPDLHQRDRWLATQGDALLKSAGGAKFTFLLLLALVFLVAIVFVEQCQRRIPVTFAKRVVGRRMYGGQSTYIPMKLNTGGVVPIIFAASVLYFPLLISNVFPSTGWGKDVQTWISNHLAQAQQPLATSLCTACSSSCSPTSTRA